MHILKVGHLRKLIIFIDTFLHCWWPVTLVTFSGGGVGSMHLDFYIYTFWKQKYSILFQRKTKFTQRFYTCLFLLVGIGKIFISSGRVVNYIMVLAFNAMLSNCLKIMWAEDCDVFSTMEWQIKKGNSTDMWYLA